MNLEEVRALQTGHQPWATGASGAQYCGSDEHYQSTVWPCPPYQLAELVIALMEQAEKAAAATLQPCPTCGDPDDHQALDGAEPEGAE